VPDKKSVVEEPMVDGKSVVERKRPRADEVPESRGAAKAYGTSEGAHMPEATHMPEAMPEATHVPEAGVTHAAKAEARQRGRRQH